mmetsp:Transcript_28978/g.97742  ORF Transcript_28978/g.97742 Transcript_28978/m.97742 type:complete len:332 (+) Transcript_28978:2024-3019(+)
MAVSLFGKPTNFSSIARNDSKSVATVSAATPPPPFCQRTTRALKGFKATSPEYFSKSWAKSPAVASSDMATRAASRSAGIFWPMAPDASRASNFIIPRRKNPGSTNAVLTRSATGVARAKPSRTICRPWRAPFTAVRPNAEIVSVSFTACRPCALNAPENGAIVRALEASLSASLAKRSPVLITLPAVEKCLMLPVSAARMGMIIFMASTSAYGLPCCTSAPSSTSQRTSLPVTSDRTSEGSKAAGMNTVAPSMDMRRPSGSSRPVSLRETPPMSQSSVPSGCSLARAENRVAEESPRTTMEKESRPVRVASMEYLTSRTTTDVSKVSRSS